MEELDYEQDLYIDESALDVEWLEQPELVMKYVKYTAEAEAMRDQKKEYLDFVAAQLDKDVRDQPELHGITKVTEATVEAAIKRSNKYQDATKEYLDAKYEAKIARGALDAVQSKQYSLQELGRLHQLQWFPGPSVPRDLGAERQKKQKASESADIAIGEGISTRRKRTRK